MRVESITQILVVEDNPADLFLLEEHLGAISEWKILHADRISGAREILANAKVDLVFLDLNLPDSNGLETFHQLNHLFPELPIIIMSGLQDTKLALQAIQAGAEDYIVKGEFDERHLISSVRYSVERKRNTLRLKESEQTRKLIMDAALDAIICMDLKGFITIWTPQAERIFGWKREEVLGKTVAETIIPSALSHQHIRGVERYLATGEGPIMNRLIETTALHKNGTTFPVELTVTHIRERDNDFFCSYIRDITERVQAGETIKREKQLSDDVINSLPGLFYVFDETGKYIRWNRQKELITGYSSEQIAGMSPLDFFSPVEKPRISEHIRQAFETGVIRIEAPIRTASGAEIPFYFTGLAVIYGGRKCLLGTGIDISDRKKAEMLLQESSEQLRLLSAHLQTVREKERMDIAREIHDELGQQLTVLKMDISWLQKKYNSEDPRVIAKMKELTGLVDHTVRTVRKISSDLRPSMLDDLGLVPALEWHSQEFEKRSGIRTNFESALHDIRVPGEIATAVFRIFQESLTNVARHAEATDVRASLKIADGHLLLKISDNGNGFSPEEIGRKQTLGILGMRERAAIMKGKYHIESHPGTGTTVEVTVPVDFAKN